MNARLTNNNIQAYNPDLLDGQQVAHLTADTASASGNLTVDNIAGFAVDQYVLIGNFGEKTAEIIKLHAATAPTGTTITLATNTTFDHYVDTPVTIIQFNQVEFSRATTLTGSKSVLATSAIAADRLWTSYTDTTNSTGYAFTRFKNSTSSVFSGYSTGINYATGNAAYSFEKLAEEGCSIAGNTVGDDFSKLDQLLRDVNEAQKVITSVQDWSFELYKDNTAFTSLQDENEYDLDDLTYAMKYPDTYQSILNVKFADSLLDYISPDEMDEEFEDVAYTTLNADVLAGATSFTVTDSYEFPSTNGTLASNANTIVYTTNTKSTGTLTGVTGTTYAMSSGDTIWYGVTPGTPEKYTVYNNSLILDVPVSSTEAGKKIKLKYLRKIDDLSTLSSTTDIPFYQCIPWYIAHKIQTRKQNHEEAQKYLDKFYQIVQFNADRYKLPMLEEEQYYQFTNKDDMGADATTY